MRIALMILVALLIISAAIGVSVILMGSFGDTEVRVLATSGVLSSYTVLMMPSLFHIEGGRYSHLTRLAVTATSITLVLILLLIWGVGPIGEEPLFRVLASVAVLSVATNHSLVLLITRSAKLIVQISQRATIAVIASVAAFFMFAIWNDGMEEPFLRVFLALAVLDALGSIATPILVRSTRSGT